MIEFIKKFVPNKVIYLYRKYDYKKKSKQSKFKDLEITETFSKIFEANQWGSNESISGPGSDMTQTRVVRNELPTILKNYNIKTFLDVPCGDFNWMKEVDLSGINYTGGDIVAPLIEITKSKYEKENIKFQVLDLTKDSIPESDMILCRDCLMHLSYENIYSALKNIVASKSKYLLTTCYVNTGLNYSIVTGDWSAINLSIAPFNLPKPLLILNEECTEANGKFWDKSLVLYEIDKIVIPPTPYK